MSTKNTKYLSFSVAIISSTKDQNMRKHIAVKQLNLSLKVKLTMKKWTRLSVINIVLERNQDKNILCLQETVISFLNIFCENALQF